MSELMMPVDNGKVLENNATTTTAEKTETKGTTELGQDAFLKLLICEMQNQDPLEPTTNTEWISQMATFSQLEELQALSKTTENTQLFSLVGKTVIVSTEDASGNTKLKEGVVDFISLSGGTAKFSVNGELYSMEELYSVVDTDYLYEQNKPGVPEQVTFSFNGDEPEDLQFEVNLGSDLAEATELAVVVGNAVLGDEYVSLSGSTVTVKKEILQELSAGTYKFSVVFNDEKLTTVDDKITVNIYNPHPTISDEAENTEEDAAGEESEEAEEV